MSSSRLYSAVVDPKGLFPAQAERLVYSLTGLCEVKPEQIVLHVVGEIPSTFQRSFERLGVELVPVSSFPGNPYCNKLQQLPALLNRKFEDVVLLDCDVVVLEPPPRAIGKLSGKAVDFGNPPINILESVFSKAKLPLKLWTTDIDQLPTAWANCNGGVYIIDHDLMSQLAAAWTHWSHWCMENSEVFKDFVHHVDQVSFAMAVASEGLPFEPLDPRFNFPSHVMQYVERDCDPAVIHYHRAIDDQQFLQPVEGLQMVNKAITRVNQLLQIKRRSRFENSFFWNARYLQHTELGSGVGSRGAILDKKISVIKEVIKILSPLKVADIGAGDGNTVSQIPKDVYLCGFDVAPVSEDIYRESRDGNDWQLYDICESPLQGGIWDLVICLDLLIHYSSMSEYQSAIENLTKSESPLLVSGFDAIPVANGPMTYFHEPLSFSLQNQGYLTIPICAYRGLTMFLAFPKGYFCTKFRLPEDLMVSAIPYLEDPIHVLTCVQNSFERLGFFPIHLPRLIEYSWILKRMNLIKDARVVDAGAGLSILPFMLADLGHTVTTIDSNKEDRTRTDQKTWNEWGFLDYSSLDPRISSLNIGFESNKISELDVVLSVSVIEHLPSEVRKRWIEKASEQLVLGGLLLLTVDLIPFTNRLWNYSQGELVDLEESHGSIDDLLSEIKGYGFNIINCEITNYLPRSRVGMAKVVAQRFSVI